LTTSQKPEIAWLATTLPRVRDAGGLSKLVEVGRFRERFEATAY
jgi:hypothetical protein